jgi:hypothetical protein
MRMGARWERCPYWADWSDGPAGTCRQIPCFLYVVLGSICKTFASFQHILWPSSYVWLINFHFSYKRHVKLYLCSLMRTSTNLLVPLMQHLPQSHGMLNTYIFVCWALLSGQIFINVPRNVCLALKMVLRWKRLIDWLTDASEYLGNTLNIWDDYSALVYCVWRGTVSCLWLRYRGNEFF